MDLQEIQQSAASSSCRAIHGAEYHPRAMALRDVLPTTWSDAGPVPTVGGVSLANLADTHGTPVYVVDEEHIRRRFESFRAAFGDDAHLAFAAKSFFCVAMAELVAEGGWWVDTVSSAEIATARRGGVPPHRILFHGNYKTDDELASAAANGVGRVIIDDPSDVPRLARHASEKVGALLRLNVDVGADTHPHIRTTGADVHFGMSADAADASIALSKGTPVDLVGVHVHIGSQIADPAMHRAAAEAAIDFVEERPHEFPDRYELDIGGGMSAPYLRTDEVPSISAYGEAVLGAIGNRDVQLIVEPGRSVVANAGISLYRVGVRKEATPPFLAVDGGISDNPRPALYGARYEAIAVDRVGDAHDSPFRIVGRHCETGDRITTANLPQGTGPGDVLAIPATGAYAFSMASRYNMLPRRPVVFVADGVARVAVAGEEIADVVR